MNRLNRQQTTPETDTNHNGILNACGLEGQHFPQTHPQYFPPQTHMCWEVNMPPRSMRAGNTTFPLHPWVLGGQNFTLTIAYWQTNISTGLMCAGGQRVHKAYVRWGASISPRLMRAGRPAFPLDPRVLGRQHFPETHACYEANMRAGRQAFPIDPYVLGTHLCFNAEVRDANRHATNKSFQPSCAFNAGIRDANRHEANQHLQPIAVFARSSGRQPA